MNLNINLGTENTIIKLYHYSNKTDVYYFLGNYYDLFKNDIEGNDSDLFLNKNNKSSSLTPKLKKFLEEKGNLLPDDNNIYCIDDVIALDDNINMIKNKIFFYLSKVSKEPSKNIYYKNESQYLWGEFKKYHNEIELETIFNNFSEKRDVIKYGILLEKINKIKGCNKKEKEKEDEKDKFYNFKDFLEDKDLIGLLNELPETVGFSIRNRKENVLFNKNPINLLNQKNIFDTSFVTNSGEKIANINKNYENNLLLESYGNLINNTLHMIDVYYFKKLIEEKISKMEIVELKKKDQILYDKICYSLINIYFDIDTFPFKNETKTKTQKGNYEDVKKLILETKKIQKYIKDGYTKKNLEIEDQSIIQAMVHINFSKNEEEFIDLEKIFNIFELSYDVPFLKYKSEKNNLINYKIYKPITEIDSDDYIGKKKIKQWKSNIDLSYKNNLLLQTGKRKGIPKGLDFKIKIDKNRYASVCLYKDGKVEIKLFWEESDNANYYNIKKSVDIIGKVLKTINKGNIDIKFDSNRKISLPDIDFLIKMKNECDTSLVYINCISKIKINKNIEMDILTKDYFLKLYPYVNVDKKLKRNNSIEMRFKKIENYMKTEEVEFRIKNMKYYNISNSDIIDELSKIYNIIPEEIIELVEKIDTPKSKIELQNPGIQIILYVSKANPQECRLFINGIKSKSQLERIRYFILGILELYQNDIKIESTNLKVAEIEEEKIKEIIDKQIKNDSNDNIESNSNNYDNSDNDSNNYSKLFLDANSDNESNEKENEKEDGNENINKKTNIDELEKKKNYKIKLADRSDEDIKKELGLLDRIQLYVPAITNSDLNYARKCQKKKQPILVDEYTKNKIDELDNNLSKAFNKEIKSYSYAAKYAFPKDSNKYYYICPHYWSVEEEYSIAKECYDEIKDKNNILVELKLKINDPFFKKLDEKDQNILTKLGGKVINDFGKGSGLDAQGKDVSVQSVKMGAHILKRECGHPYYIKLQNGKAFPCCGTLSKKTSIKDFKQYDQGIETLKEKNNEYEYTSEDYIFNEKKIPINVNDRFGLIPTKLDNFLNNVFNEKNSKANRIKVGKLIKGKSYFLRGGLPNNMKQSFIASLSKILLPWNEKKHPETLLSIIKQNIDPGTFRKLNAGNLQFYFRDKNNTKITDKNDLNELITWGFKYKEFIIKEGIEIILGDNFDIEDYLESKEKHHINRIYTLFRSFQRFILYLDTNEQMDEIPFWDLFSRKFKWIWNDNDEEKVLESNGLNIIIFEYKYDDENEYFDLKCPHDGRTEYLYNKNKKTCFLLRYTDNITKSISYEPLLLVKNEDSFLYYYKIFPPNHLEYNSDENKLVLTNPKYKDLLSDDTIDTFNRIQNNSNKLIDLLNTCSNFDNIQDKIISTFMKDIEFQIIDNFNKVMAIYLNNGTIIPLKNQPIIDK